VPSRRSQLGATAVRRSLRGLALLAAWLVALLVVAAATGWLYLLRPHTPMGGPGVRDALPLDELAGHSRVPVLIFVLTWATAGAVIGAIAAMARIERLTAGITAALLTGAWLYATNGLSIAIVRQIPFKDAYRAALQTPSLYLAALLCGLGGALFGRRSEGSVRRAPAILATLVAAFGLLDVFSAITPELANQLSVIEDAAPDIIPRLASALVVPAGLGLIVLARGLRRRRRRAWQLTVFIVFASAVLHMLKGLDYEEAIANTLLGVALVARRHDFAGRGDPTQRRPLLLRLALYTAAIFAYGFVALWANRVAVDRPFTLGFALEETGRSMLGLNVQGSARVTGHFGEWFPLSVLLLTVMAALSLLWSWVGPWRFRVAQHAAERQRAHKLVARWGVDTLAPFTLRGDKNYFFSEDELAFLAYVVIAGVAVVSGDPVGPDASVQALLGRFVSFAHERDWRVAVLGASERYLPLYERLGLRSLYHGDEAVVDVASFSLEGRAIRKVRQSVARLERAGYRPDIRYAGDVDDDTRADLEDIFAGWCGTEPVKGFTMELDQLFRLVDEDAVFVIGRSPDGRPRGFLHFAVARPGRALSLSSMPRQTETPNGFNEWLVCAAVEWARRNGFERVSLNFAPFAELLGSDEPLAPVRRLERRALLTLKGRFQLDNLLNFNRKFFPRWNRRYVVYEHLTDLPRVGIAGLAAEGYLSLPGLAVERPQAAPADPARTRKP
jgi:lysyl-tRNA synthetase class 2